jgi:hypothetical protein
MHQSAQPFPMKEKRLLRDGCAILLLLLIMTGSEIFVTGGFPVRNVYAVSPGAAKAAGFSLADQSGNWQTWNFPRNKVSILAFGDRKGSSQMEGWIRPLYERYRDRIDIQGVAVLSSVPGFAQGMVRRIIKSQTKAPVLLDWKGDVSRSYQCQSGRANLFVIDPQGNIALTMTGAASDAELSRIYSEVDKLLSGKR